MKNVFSWLWGIVLTAVGVIVGIFSFKKNKDIKKVEKKIITNKKLEKQIVKKIEKLSDDKKGNKKTITILKEELKSIQKDIKETEKTFDDVDDATEFLRKFSKK